MRLLVVGAGEQREVEQVARHPPPRHPAGAGHRDDLGEHLLHRQRRPDLDAHARLAVAGVREAVHHARRDLDDVAGPGERPCAGRGGSASGPRRPRSARSGSGARAAIGTAPPGRSPRSKREQLAAGGRGGLDEREALAGDRVLERLSGVMVIWEVVLFMASSIRRTYGLSMTQNRAVLCSIVQATWTLSTARHGPAKARDP